MAGKITVNPSDLETGSTFLNQCAEEYSSLAKQLMNAATTMGSAYDSDDNRAFVNQIEGCTTDLNKMVEKVRQQANILKKQAEVYRKTTEDNISVVRTLQQ